MQSKSLSQIQSILRSRLEELHHEFGVKEIGVFGSYVRNEANKKSDIDILVSFNRQIGFFEFLRLEETLSEWLGAKVDLVTKAALKPHIGKRILNEVTMI